MYKYESAEIPSEEKKALIAQFLKINYTIILDTKDKSHSLSCTLKDIEIKE
jgi:hypothetical protein